MVLILKGPIQKKQIEQALQLNPIGFKTRIQYMMQYILWHSLWYDEIFFEKGFCWALGVKVSEDDDRFDSPVMNRPIVSTVDYFPVWKIPIT